MKILNKQVESFIFNGLRADFIKEINLGRSGLVVDLDFYYTIIPYSSQSDVSNYTRIDVQTLQIIDDTGVGNQIRSDQETITQIIQILEGR